MKAAIALVVLLATTPAHAALVAELSQREVAVTTGFTGAELLVFGAKDQEGGDLIVAVRGPAQALVVRRRTRVLGIWVNGRSEIFDTAPSFYAISATRPLDQLLSPMELTRLRLGAESLPLNPIGQRDDPEFRAALLEQRSEQGLYLYDDDGVVVTGDRLFHTRIFLPPVVIPGAYRVDILMVRDGVVAAQRDLTLRVRRAGASAAIWRFAQDFPLFYGIGAVIAAAATGWLGSVLFRRG